MFDLQSVKQRYGIIATSPKIDRAIEIALQVAVTDLSVLVMGESGVGKESFPKIIHDNSARKHNTYIAVNCGAIPEGTIDSELFGHEKGAFTGATEARKGYFEQSNGGTIFLDEVAELPLSTQARLLRILESGEFIRVGSSKVQKTNVRVVAATNVKLQEAIAMGKFREDLYYRLNTVPIFIPPLRERKQDILLLFKKFALDFADKYHMPAIQLDTEAEHYLINYSFPGNVRQLKNIVEQISVIESDRKVESTILNKYIPNIDTQSSLQIFRGGAENKADMAFERELIFKFLAEMQKDINDLKNQIASMHQGGVPMQMHQLSSSKSLVLGNSLPISNEEKSENFDEVELTDYVEGSEDESVSKNNFSLQDQEKDMILKALKKNNGKRKETAKDLGISERTLYRKLLQFNLN